MNLLRLFGRGSKKIIARGRTAQARVDAVRQCWWIKINTKPFRRDMWDGAVFPFIISFSYDADGIPCHGKGFVPYRLSCPRAGDTVSVSYDPDHPRRCAVRF